MGTPPIDVLDVASRRYAMARRAMITTRALQAGPAAEARYQQAVAWADAAQDDVRRAQLVASYLGGYHGAGLQSGSGLHGGPIRSWADV